MKYKIFEIDWTRRVPRDTDTREMLIHRSVIIIYSRDLLPHRNWRKRPSFKVIRTCCCLSDKCGEFFGWYFTFNFCARILTNHVNILRVWCFVRHWFIGIVIISGILRPEDPLEAHINSIINFKKLKNNFTRLLSKVHHSGL